MAARRAIVVAIEACTLLVIGAVLSAATGLSFWGAVCLLALAYYPITNAFFGQTFAVRVLNRALLSPARRPLGTARAAKSKPAPIPPLSPEVVNQESAPRSFGHDEQLPPLFIAADERPDGRSREQVLL
jgi:hypothetical protein